MTASGEGGGGWTENNHYDRYGNRRIDFGGGNYSLTFDPANNRITGKTYDSVGNLTVDGTATYGYDAENRMISLNSTTGYTYDGEGRRVRKLIGENTRFIYGINGELIVEFSGSNGNLTKEYVSGGGMMAVIDPTAGTRYITADHLASPRVVTNSSGSVVSRHDYMPFGVEVWAGTSGRSTALGYGNTDGVRDQFTGYERDNETGLDYAQARYYGSAQGRFTSVDPLMASARGFNPQTWNRYSYVLNRPLSLVDPNGTKDCTPQNPCQDYPENWATSGNHPQQGLIQETVNVNISSQTTLETTTTNLTMSIQETTPSSDPASGPPTSSGTSPDTSAMGRVLTVASTASTIAEYGTVSPFSGAWRGANGQWNAPGWGGNGATAGRSLVLQNAGAIRGLGRSLGVAGIALSVGQGYQAYERGDNLGAVKSGFDAGFGVAGTFGGPYGAGAATIYFAVDMTIGWREVSRQGNKHPMITGVTPSPFLF